MEVLKKKRSTHKLNGDQRGIVLQLLATDLTLAQVVGEVKNQFDIELCIQALDYYRTNYKEEINRLRVEYYRDMTFTFPLSHKGCRLKELVGLYRQTDVISEKVSILRALKAEIGEDVDKIADAIVRSGSNNIINIGITSVDIAELKRLAEEAGSFLGVGERADRAPVA